GHEADLVVAELVDVELLTAARAARGDHRLDLRVPQGPVEARPLPIQDLAANPEDHLRVRVAALRGGAGGGVALDDVDLGDRGVLRLAVLELAGHAAGLEEALAAGRLARLAGGQTGLRGLGGLAHDLLRLRRVGLHPVTELIADDALDEGL